MLEVKQRIIEFINRRQVFDSAPAELVKPDGSDWIVPIPPDVYYGISPKLQVMDVVKTRGFLVGNVVTYVLRAGKKTPNPLSDLIKARDNLDILISLVTSNDK